MDIIVFFDGTMKENKKLQMERNDFRQKTISVRSYTDLFLASATIFGIILGSETHSNDWNASTKNLVASAFRSANLLAKCSAIR